VVQFQPRPAAPENLFQVQSMENYVSVYRTPDAAHFALVNSPVGSSSGVSMNAGKSLFRASATKRRATWRSQLASRGRFSPISWTPTIVTYS
jgi:hypothetical protein